MTIHVGKSQPPMPGRALHERPHRRPAPALASTPPSLARASLGWQKRGIQNFQGDRRWLTDDALGIRPDLLFDFFGLTTAFTTLAFPNMEETEGGQLSSSRAPPRRRPATSAFCERFLGNGCASSPGPCACASSTRSPNLACCDQRLSRTDMKPPVSRL